MIEPVVRSTQLKATIMPFFYQLSSIWYYKYFFQIIQFILFFTSIMSGQHLPSGEIFSQA